MLSRIIAVDFDGTLCENKWPDIGAPNTQLIEALKDCQNIGCKIILWTCRTKLKLRHALRWCGRQGLIFDAVNRNLPEVIEHFGSDTRKIFAHYYIDDKNYFLDGLPFHPKEDICKEGNSSTEIK